MSKTLACGEVQILGTLHSNHRVQGTTCIFLSCVKGRYKVQSTRIGSLPPPSLDSGCMICLIISCIVNTLAHVCQKQDICTAASKHATHYPYACLPARYRLVTK